MEKPLLETLEPLDVSARSALKEIEGLVSNHSVLKKTPLNVFHLPPNNDRENLGSDLAAHYQNGMIAGERRALNLHQATVSALEKSLAALQQEFSNMINTIKSDHSRALVQILETAMPSLSRAGFLSEVDYMIQDLSQAELSGKIVIECSETDIENITHFIKKSAKADNFVVKAADKSPQKVTIEWTSGGALIDYEKTTKTVMTRLLDDLNLTPNQATSEIPQ